MSLFVAIADGIGFVENTICRAISNSRRLNFDASTIFNLHTILAAGDLGIVQNKSAACGACNAISEILDAGIFQYDFAAICSQRENTTF